MKKIKVMLIHTLPSPYRNPLLKLLTEDKEIEYDILFMARGAGNRIWQHDELGFKHRFLPGWVYNLKSNNDIFPIWINPTVPLEIVKGKYDVVLCTGWDSLATFLSWISCSILDIPMIVWAGSTAREKSWRRTIMSLPVKALVRSVSALIVYGTASKEYLESLGAESKKVFISYNSVDIDFFRSIYKENIKKKMTIRKKLGIKNKLLVLYVGQLIRRKGVLDLYEAVKNINKNVDIGILWVGYGELKKVLEDMGKKDKFNDQYFMTTTKIEETAKMYSIADFFVIPTHEDLFSNVVAEALASGLPVISTRENGASRDLIKEGVNGFVIDAGDVDTLTKRIELIANNSSLRSKLSSNTWNSIKNFNYKSNVKGFNQAIKFALDSK